MPAESSKSMTIEYDETFMININNDKGVRELEKRLDNFQAGLKWGSL